MIVYNIQLSHFSTLDPPSESYLETTLPKTNFSALLLGHSIITWSFLFRALVCQRVRMFLKSWTYFQIRAPRTDGHPYVLGNFASYPKIRSLDIASGEITVMTQCD